MQFIDHADMCYNFKKSIAKSSVQMNHIYILYIETGQI